ncbi:hypothetical protein ABOM_011750 [Aspergillus bombycis]|uniref:Uncharacterized protein n=1 Tax=Aspergillus bombycis TaxID=109264 RepID=A0A1F7ZJ60_9EURO|nr:hypothetical protein ABOM_011750 [Aspergillus bombycis]OGM39481.1 hypothetical protein ABOM_011750 [Aspergillus bombycis]
MTCHSNKAYWMVGLGASIGNSMLAMSGPESPTLKMFVTRGISLVNFTVASSALAFQVFVLYPWHNQLDDEFKALKQEHLRVLRRADQLIAQKL